MSFDVRNINFTKFCWECKYWKLFQHFLVKKCNCYRVPPEPGPGDHCHHCDQNLAIKMKWPSCGHRLLAATAGWKIANINIDIDKSPVSAASADPDHVQGSIFSGQSGPFSARSRGTILEERAVTFQVSNTSLQIIIMSKHPAEFQSPNKSCRGFCSEWSVFTIMEEAPISHISCRLTVG